MEYLPAINQVLATIGEAPIATLGSGHQLEDAVVGTLDLITAREAGKGWWFNTASTVPYAATAVAFDDLPESFAQYVLALAQVRFIKDYDGDEAKAASYAVEATMARAAMFSEHLRNILAGMSSLMAAATGALIRVANDAATTGSAADAYRSDTFLGANRLDTTISKTLTEVSRREQLAGWWFNTDDDGVITVMALADVPAIFLEYVTAMAAIRIAKVYGSSGSAAAEQVRMAELKEEAAQARAILGREHIRNLAINMLYTPAVMRAMTWFTPRYRIR